MSRAYNQNGEAYKDGESTMSPQELRVWTRWAEQGVLHKYLGMNVPSYQRALETAAAKA